jgi:hypothetical protein
MLGVEFLVSNGTNALAAQDALSRYLQGKELNTQQQALVSRIIRAYGSPPEGAPTLEEPIPTPEDPPDTPQTGPRWHSTTPSDVVNAYSAASVASVLSSLGIDYKARGPSAVDKFDVADGLRKLGWRNTGDVSLTLRNVGRLLAKTKPSTPQKPTVTPKWGRGIPLSVRRAKDARVTPIRVKSALMKVGIRPGNYIQGYEIKRGYKKVGMTTTKLNPEKVGLFVSKVQARG